MDNAPPYVIEMLHITKEFPGIKANDDITLQLKKGEIHALLGENGAGKSTLMSVLFGLYQPEAGEIRKNGKPVKIDNPNDATALGIGMVHQHFKLIDVFTVLDNIILGAETTKLGFIQRKEARKKVEELSEKYGLKVDLDAKVEDITVGMQQRVEILKMLYRDNEILIFDEPTAVLTPQEIDELMATMKEFAREGKSILFISHKLNEIMAVADRVTVLRKGKCIGTVNTCDTNKQELSNMMVGRPVQLVIDKTPAHPGEEILHVEDLCVLSHLHKRNAVDHVSFNVRAGEIVCIAGIDGNGQTELIHGLTGLDKITGGSVTLCGETITHASIRRRGRNMSHIPEDRHKHGLVLDFTLEQNLVLQRYKEPQFQHGGFIPPRRRARLRRPAHRAVRRPQRPGRRHDRAQHVRRQPAEGHHRPRGRPGQTAHHRRAAHARPRRRRDRIHPQAARRPARRGQGRAARVARARRGHEPVRPHPRHVRGADRRRARPEADDRAGARSVYVRRQAQREGR